MTVESGVSLKTYEESFNLDLCRAVLDGWLPSLAPAVVENNLNIKLL